jgi:hypothetical protein
MHVLREFFKGVWQRRIQNEYDHIVLVIADEGDGKSTFILQALRWWAQFLGVEQSPETLFDFIAWDQSEFRGMMANADERLPIAAMDAARVLNKSKAQKGDQKDLIEDLFDVRTKEHLFLMGYQQWRSVPTTLQERRAKNVLYIPRRGLVRGYNRESMDHKVDHGEWPEPQLTARFPALDGEPLWHEFRKLDKQHKRENIGPDEADADGEDDGPGPVERVVDDIVSGDPATYVTTNEFNQSTYVDADLIEYDYDLTVRQAKQAKKVIERRVDVERLASDSESGGEGGKHTA